MKVSSLLENGNLLRDIAILAFLAGVMGVILLVDLGPSDTLTSYAVMTIVTFIAVAFAFFGRISLSIIIAGGLVCGWTAFKLYSIYANGTALISLDYLWLPAPLLLAGSACLFQSGSSKLEDENLMLRGQVEELVMVEPLTGLYNLRAMYREIPQMSRFCMRRKMPLSLMLVQLRYPTELRSFLSARHFDMLKQRLAEIVHNQLRIEDRLFSVDDVGSLAILLSSEELGCDLVKRRLRTNIEDVAAFKGITDDNIVVSVRIAYKLCTEELGRAPIELKMRVESDLQYDV